MSESSKNTIIFTIGRMNPPTPGHIKLIATMMQSNFDLPPDDLGRGRVYIILSHSETVYGSDAKNPLGCNRKRELLTDIMVPSLKKTNPLWNAIEVIILCLRDINPRSDAFNDTCGHLGFIYNQVCRIISIETGLGHRPTNMELIVGSDRIGGYTGVIKILSDLHKKITFNELDVDGNRIFDKYIKQLTRVDAAGSADISDITTEQMSGTIVRESVYTNPNKIMAMYKELGLNNHDANVLLNQLQNNTDMVKLREAIKLGVRNNFSEINNIYKSLNSLGQNKSEMEMNHFEKHKRAGIIKEITIDMVHEDAPFVNSLTKSLELSSKLSVLCDEDVAPIIKAQKEKNDKDNAIKKRDKEEKKGVDQKTTKMKQLGGKRTIRRRKMTSYRNKKRVTRFTRRKT